MEIVYDGFNFTLRPPNQKDPMKQHRTPSARVPFWLRWLVPVLLVLTWLAVAGIGGPTFGRLDEVSSNDQASFLPAGAEATAAQEWQAKFRDSNQIPAVIVIENDSAFTPAQLEIGRAHV